MSNQTSHPGDSAVRYVAFLRGINLGKRRVQMSRLRSLLEELGVSDVATFIASGNVIFSAIETSIPRLEAAIAEHLEQALGYEVDTFVRTLARVVAIAESTPFATPRDGESTYVTFLHNALHARTASALAGIRSEHDRFAVEKLEYFWACSIRSSDSRIWASPEIKSLSLPAGTTRNMTSIRKLVAAHGPALTPARTPANTRANTRANSTHRGRKSL